MSAVILNQKPTSGDYPEKHFGQTYNSRLWVKFSGNNLQEWVGCFPRTNQTIDKVLLDKVLIDNANETAIVVAGGQVYLIDISNRELLYETDNMPIVESVIHTTNPEYFLVGACYRIYLFDSRKLIKRFDPDFSLDGIYFTEQKGQKAIGHLHSYDYQQDLNFGFTFDLLTNEMIIDRNVKIRQIGPFEFISATEKEKKGQENFFTKILRRLTNK
ncbi:MAG: hypothetical protein KG003_02610 [Bacteroidetes bacterium]|nr:hypothetical protein [Bacteroidota bacterium]